jgi:hypothetical protein
MCGGNPAANALLESGTVIGNLVLLPERWQVAREP